jgi:hypothetical protein
MSLRSLDVWKRLEAHRDQMRDVHLRTLFAHDPGRFGRFSLQLDDLLVDFSKQPAAISLKVSRNRKNPCWAAGVVLGL